MTASEEDFQSQRRNLLQIFYNPSLRPSRSSYYENVQKQLGGIDCGCFALAYAASLWYRAINRAIRPKGDAHTSARCNQQSETHSVLHSRKAQTAHPFYCVCQLPDDGSEMILCIQCAEWYHTSCVKVTRKFTKYSGLQWTCDKCRL